MRWKNEVRETMNETLKKRIAALERRTSDAGKLDAIKACLTGLFGEFGGGDTPEQRSLENFVPQISEEVIKNAGVIGKQFIMRFGLEKCEDGFYREKRRKPTEDKTGT